MIDFSPLFRTAVGFDHLASMLEEASRSEQGGYPPYNIELTGELERAGAREVGIGEHRPRVWASPGSAAMHHVSELQTVNDVAPREPEMNGSRFQGIREPEGCLIRDRRSLQYQ